MDRFLEILSEILIESATLLGVVGAAVCFGVGVLMLLAPDVVARISEQLSGRWFSARRALRPIEVPRHSERYFYRYHRMSGGALLAGTLVVAWFLVQVNAAEVVSVFARWGPRPVVEWLVEAGAVFLWTVTVVGALIGAIVLVRPSALKSLEGWSNRWISTRRATRFLERSHDPLARLYGSWPRTVGAFVMLGSLYFLIVMGLILSERL